jgi:hypothetical protein
MSGSTALAWSPYSSAGKAVRSTVTSTCAKIVAIPLLSQIAVCSRLPPQPEGWTEGHAFCPEVGCRGSGIGVTDTGCGMVLPTWNNAADPVGNPFDSDPAALRYALARPAITAWPWGWPPGSRLSAWSIRAGGSRHCHQTLPCDAPGRTAKTRCPLPRALAELARFLRSGASVAVYSDFFHSRLVDETAVFFSGRGHAEAVVGIRVWTTDCRA